MKIIALVDFLLFNDSHLVKVLEIFRQAMLVLGSYVHLSEFSDEVFRSYHF